MRILSIILARCASTRSPGQLLHPIEGKPLIRLATADGCGGCEAGQDSSADLAHSR